MTTGPSITNAELPASEMTGSADIAPDARYHLVIEEFTNRLHSVLDYYQLMADFINEVRTVLPCGGIEYSQHSIRLYYSDGVTGRHSCKYELRHGGEFLGEISFTRETAFHEHELVLIEIMVGGLIMPLRNALKYQQAIHFAQRDELTGLRNERYYQDSVELEIKRAQRYQIPFSLLLVDIDDFAHINDHYGRDAGDAVLVEVGARVRRASRDSDIVFRGNGDRFLVFLPHSSSVDASLVAERIRACALAGPFTYRTLDINLTMSVGVVTVSPKDSRYKLTERAGRAVFHAKVLGKNRVHVDTSADNLRERLTS